MANSKIPDQQSLDNSIWKWFDGEYKVHCSDREMSKQMIRWKRSRPGGIYYLPVGSREFDVIIPDDYYDRAVRLLTCKKNAQTRKVDTNSLLKDNDLQEPKSPVSEEKLEESNLSLRNVFRRTAEKSKC